MPASSATPAWPDYSNVPEQLFPPPDNTTTTTTTASAPQQATRVPRAEGLRYSSSFTAAAGPSEQYRNSQIISNIHVERSRSRASEGAGGRAVRQREEGGNRRSRGWEEYGRSGTMSATGSYGKKTGERARRQVGGSGGGFLLDSALVPETDVSSAI